MCRSACVYVCCILCSSPQLSAKEGRSDNLPSEKANTQRKRTRRFSHGLDLRVTTVYQLGAKSAGSTPTVGSSFTMSCKRR
ncbi:hypothetical protein BDV97DRAFT_179347 [Delphinella strobiligena]|nr:hypothetical protein BDV97DRAFT_179347 [Delphinella strobiligena]